LQAADVVGLSEAGDPLRCGGEQGAVSGLAGADREADSEVGLTPRELTMIRSVRGNLLPAEADALVNTVGVMGKGIALVNRWLTGKAWWDDVYAPLTPAL
jgi:hypothetical protein